MKRELIIEKYGTGNAVGVMDSEKIVDLFIDPPLNSNFYPPNTFVEARVQRRIQKRGGYFVRLPNGCQGFLNSKSNYKEGEALVLLSKVFFDSDKPQRFTDKLKIISKYFILKLGDSGVSFSKKISNDFDKELLIPILKEQIKDHEGIFVICRSQVAEISIEECNRELEKILQHHKFIQKELLSKKIYYDGLAKKLVLDKYSFDNRCMVEEEGIFERLGLWDQIYKLSQKQYYINGGSNLILEQTSSFLAIDVNSGNDLSIEVRELNLLACGEICRLIKVLGFGGKIMIDFLPCSKEVKKEIYRFIVGSFKDDNPANKIWGWTKGASFEMERERDKVPLNLLVQHN